MLRPSLCLLIALALPLASATARAQEVAEADRAQAREQFATGVARYEAGDHQGALEAFQEAYRLAPHPTVRVNMANCYEHLGRPLEAVHHFERFLAESEGAPRQQRREVEAAIRRLSQQLAEVRLTIAPDGASVTIDAAETRRAPVLEPIRLTAGAHAIEVRADGYRTIRRDLQLTGGQSERLTIRLERGVDPPPPIAIPTEPIEPAVPEPIEPEVPEVPPSSGGWELRVTAPVAVAGTLTIASGAGAIVSGVLALTENDRFEDAVLRSNDPAASATERAEARQDGLDAADTVEITSIVTDVLIATTIVAAGATLFFVIVEGMNAQEPPPQNPSVRFAPSIGPHGAGLVADGRF